MPQEQEKERTLTDNGSSKSLPRKIEEWLSGEGYPLEFTVAEALRASKLAVHQGYYVRDPDTGSPREIDVIADASKSYGDTLVRVRNVVECKWSRDKPWVVFTSPSSRISPAACVSQTIGTEAANAALWARAGDERLAKLSLFETPSQPGFGGRRAFESSNDMFYSAMQSVVTATSLMMESYDEGHRLPPHFMRTVVIGLPVVVVDAPLFEAKFESSDGRVAVTERESIRLHWKGAAAWTFHATVDVVSAKFIDEFARQRAADSKELVSVLESTVRELQECCASRTLVPLTVFEAARGVIGLPPLLAVFTGSARRPRQEAEGEADDA